MHYLGGIKKWNQEKLPSFVDCLSTFAVKGDGESFLQYTRSWIKSQNRCGLFEVSDDVYLLVCDIELASRERLRGEMLSREKDEDKKKTLVTFACKHADVL